METESSKGVHLLAHTDRSHHRLRPCSDSRKRALTGSALNWVQQQKRIEIIPENRAALSLADTEGCTGEYDSFRDYDLQIRARKTDMEASLPVLLGSFDTTSDTLVTQYGATLQTSETDFDCAAIDIELSEDPPTEPTWIEETTHGT